MLYAYFLALRSIVSDVFRSERDENDGSTRKMKAKGKGMHGLLVMLLRLLLEESKNHCIIQSIMMKSIVCIQALS